MDSRKRKLKASLPIIQFLSRNFMLLCLCLFGVFALLRNGFSSGPFHPKPIVPSLAVLSSSVSNSIQESTPHHTTDNARVLSEKPVEFKVEHRVVFTDHILVILSSERNSPLQQRIDCVYSNELDGDFTYYPMMSADEYDDDRWTVQCPSPPVNYTSVVGLRGYGDDVSGFEWEAGLRESNETTRFWDYLAYEAFLDGEDTAVVLVKGLRLKSDRESNATSFRCHFKKWGSSDDVRYTTMAITAAQEVIRCPLPPPVKEGLRNNEDFEITVERIRSHEVFPSIARLHNNKDEKYGKDNNNYNYKYELCGCSMVWNQASVIKEWIAYHGWLGVQRWFVYDNNSDDDLIGVIDELDDQNYNVTRHAWPWVKSQEAGFSHCVIRARDECRWVGFFDVDEFYFFPKKNNSKLIENPRSDALRAVVDDVTLNNPSVGEIRADCHNFGPSGLKNIPEKGVTFGYTCRMKNSERHKSIVRPIAVDDTLLNQIHHFKLKKEFELMKLSQGKALINHYKYQVWNVFKAKFRRRVSTFVTDWQEKQNEKSNDRAPGLGTEAIEPSDWPTRFCEVWDSRLKDFILENLANPDSGLVPWGSIL